MACLPVMFQDEAEEVEIPAIAQLKQQGWVFVPGADLAPGQPGDERSYYRDVVLVKRLEAALRRLNPWISEENLRKVLREFSHPNFADLSETQH